MSDRLSFSNANTPAERAALKAALMNGEVDVFEEVAKLIAAETIEGAMKRLAGIARQDRTLGELGMIGLFMPAAEALHHSTVDSIELWLCKEGTPDVRLFLESYGVATTSPVSMHAEKWLENYPFDKRPVDPAAN